jgi:hypothetical protein
MTRAEGTVWCNNCGVEITWAPLVMGGGDYCCEDCYHGRACQCGERLEEDDDRRAGGGEPVG